MAKEKRQNIIISGRPANDRVERAIPKFENMGMPKAQATAVAMRMESVGRLVDSPTSGRLNVLKKNTPWGVPMTAPRGSAAIMVMAWGAKGTRKKTQQRNNTNLQADSFDDLQNETRKTTRTLKPKRTIRRKAKPKKTTRKKRGKR